MLKRIKNDLTGKDFLEFESSVNSGSVVLARFTNCGYNHQFKGEIVGKTKNYYKVKVLENFRPVNHYEPENGMCEEIGRVLHIATYGSRIHSINNAIMNLDWFEGK
jgi:hypothetical protein